MEPAHLPGQDVAFDRVQRAGGRAGARRRAPEDPALEPAGLSPRPAKDGREIVQGDRTVAELTHGAPGEQRAHESRYVRGMGDAVARQMHGHAGTPPEL